MTNDAPGARCMPHAEEVRRCEVCLQLRFWLLARCLPSLPCTPASRATAWVGLAGGRGSLLPPRARDERPETRLWAGAPVPVRRFGGTLEHGAFSF
eukprot:scaffold33410_cov26-Tisochrysis_lutea.AAC.4